jgi:hypothetical protein
MISSRPATSSECERVFSRAKQLVTGERSKLSAETIEANELQKYYLRKCLVLSWLVPSERAQLKQQMYDKCKEAVDEM